MMRWVERHVPHSVATVLCGVWYAVLIWGIFFGMFAKLQPLQYWGM